MFICSRATGQTLLPMAHSHHQSIPSTPPKLRRCTRRSANPRGSTTARPATRPIERGTLKSCSTSNTSNEPPLTAVDKSNDEQVQGLDHQPEVPIVARWMVAAAKERRHQPVPAKKMMFWGNFRLNRPHRHRLGSDPHALAQHEGRRA